MNDEQGFVETAVETAVEAHVEGEGEGLTQGDGVSVTVESEEPIEDPRVLAAIERLADLDGLPIAEQVEIFADVHARLTEALGTESESEPSGETLGSAATLPLAREVP